MYIFLGGFYAVLRWDMEMFRALFPDEIANQMISLS